MKTLASAGSDIRAVPIWIKTPFGRDDVVWGIRTEDPTGRYVAIRDVSLFAPDITYGDIVLVKQHKEKLQFVKHEQKSDWNAFVILTTSVQAAGEIAEDILSMKNESEVAARFAPGTIGPILAIAAGPKTISEIYKKIENWTKLEFISEYTETTER